MTQTSDESPQDPIGLMDLSVRITNLVCQTMLEHVSRPGDPTPAEYLALTREIQTLVLDWMRGLAEKLEAVKAAERAKELQP